MITLRQKEYNTAITLGFVLPVSNKADLYEATKLMCVEGCSRCNKAELCGIIEDLLLHEPLQWILTTLPPEEIVIVKKLVDAGPNTYVEAPMRADDRFYLIQKMFFVVSYEDKVNRGYHMVMPNSVRENCAKYIDKFITRSVPEPVRPDDGKLRNVVLDYLDKQGAPEEIKAVVRKMSSDDLLKMISPGLVTPKVDEQAEKVQEEQAKRVPVQVELLPAMTNSTDLKFRKGETLEHQVLNECTVLQVKKMIPGDWYLNVYFLHAGPDMIKVVLCLGDVINSVYGRDVLKLRLMDFLPESAKRKFPYLYKILNERTLEDFDGAYLNTMGLNGRPKQWFVMQQLDDPNGKIWADILMYGPNSPVCAKAIKAVLDMFLNIMDDIKKYGDAKVREHFERYLGISSLNTSL